MHWVSSLFTHVVDVAGFETFGFFLADFFVPDLTEFPKSRVEGFFFLVCFFFQHFFVGG
jgi:hypothetical protein